MLVVVPQLSNDGRKVLLREGLRIRGDTEKILQIVNIVLMYFERGVIVTHRVDDGLSIGHFVVTPSAEVEFE